MTDKNETTWTREAIRNLILEARPSMSNATDGELNYLWSQLSTTAQADILAGGTSAKSATPKGSKNGKSD